MEAVCNYDFSVALFAPGWTWECAASPANDFHDRDTRFWGLLQPWLATHGVSVARLDAASTVGVGHLEGVGGKSDASVFRSCFGLGQGRGRPAPKSSLPWFNLKMMEIQPSFTTLEEGEVRVVENRSKLTQSHIVSPNASTDSPTTLPLFLLHLGLNEHISLLVTMLVKRVAAKGVGVRLGLSDGNEESLEEVSLELVEKRKLEFGLALDEVVVDDEDWVEVAFEAPPSKARVVEKLGVHLPGGRTNLDLPGGLPGVDLPDGLNQVDLPGGRNQVEIAFVNICTAKL